ncbi:aspartate 1-decarboxylase [Alicyclobacillus cellulosilyticus]|uniref:aspartate 1-decarboxylase n=1 Tax=Alicyclobacillus cellulosilyticus TaxID=1003997 RepID=UPI001E38D338|nr:aspartate 1-decarboxylase [Alicyclobacillus cellulosilyticus]
MGWLRQVCKGKIHRATVTHAHLNYVGSISIDADLMAAADIRPYEMVQVTNLANGVIWQTYALAAPAGSGVIGLNGPPARHFQPGDAVIILSLAWVDDTAWDTVMPAVVFVDAHNRVERVERIAPGTGEAGAGIGQAGAGAGNPAAP